MEHNMEGPELLPCPFCGGGAERQALPDDEFGNGSAYLIACKRCLASSHVEFGYKENLVSAWNRRADLAAPSAPAEVEGLGSHRDNIIHTLRQFDDGHTDADVEKTADALTARQPDPEPQPVSQAAMQPDQNISPICQPEPQPVAWRWRMKGGGESDWDLVSGEKFPIKGRTRDELDVQPLYATPSSAGTVSVEAALFEARKDMQHVKERIVGDWPRNGTLELIEASQRKLDAALRALAGERG